MCMIALLEVWLPKLIFTLQVTFCKYFSHNTIISFQICIVLIEMEMVSTQFYCRIGSQDRRTVLLSKSQFHEKAY